MKKFKYLKISNRKKLRYINNYFKKRLYIIFLPGFMSDIDGKKPQAFIKYAKRKKLGFLAIEYSGHGKSSGDFVKGNITQWSNDAKISIKKIVKKNKFINHCREMPLAYSLADVVVSASIEPEAFGRVAVESQSMSKPIIASNIGGSKETIINKKTGLLYKHDDPRELAKSLNTVIQLNQEQLKLMGNEGRKNVTKKFDVDIMCNSNLREYKKLFKS